MSATGVGPAPAADTASSGRSRCRTAVRADEPRAGLPDTDMPYRSPRPHRRSRDKGSATALHASGRPVSADGGVPASRRRAASSSRSPAASLRTVLGGGCRLPAPGAARRLKLLFQMLAATPPVVPFLDQLRLVSFEAFDAHVATVSLTPSSSESPRSCFPRAMHPVSAPLLSHIFSSTAASAGSGHPVAREA